MNFNTYFTVFFLFAFELTLAAFLLIPEKRKFRFKPYISIPLGVIVAFGFSGIAFAVPALSGLWDVWINILVYVIMTIGVYAGAWIVYRYTWQELAIILAVAYTIQHTMYQFCSLILDTGLNGEIYKAVGGDADLYNAVYTILLESLRVIWFIIAFFLLVRPFLKNAKYILNTWAVIGICISEFLIVNLANSVAANHVPWWDGALKAAVSGTLFFCCLLLDVIIIFAFRLVRRKEEALLLEAHYNARVSQLQMTEKSVEYINIKCHDLRKQIRHLRSKMDSISEQDLLELEDALRLYDTGMKSGDASLDLLIQDKAVYCRSRKIELTTLIDGAAFQKFHSQDIYFLFLNILDNAIEAVDGLENPEKRVISLRAYERQGYCFIEETNYFVGELSINDDGSIKTTKGDDSQHGFGTKSIAYIVSKLKGAIRHEIDGDIFRLSIVI